MVNGVLMYITRTRKYCDYQFYYWTKSIVVFFPSTMITSSIFTLKRQNVAKEGESIWNVERNCHIILTLCVYIIGNSMMMKMEIVWDSNNMHCLYSSVSLLFLEQIISRALLVTVQWLCTTFLLFSYSFFDDNIEKRNFRGSNLSVVSVYSHS